MYRNENRQHTQRTKSKKSYVKKSSSHTLQSITEHSKSKIQKSAKPHNNHKLYKFKHIAATTSDYVGAERLTKHVGIYNKGKISDSISRYEKRLPKEVRARAEQDLKQVLKLTNGDRHKQRKRYRLKLKHKSHSVEKSLPNSVNSSALCHNSGFASTSWHNKLQKSVGLASVNNSILASVHEQSSKKSLIRTELLIARKTLLTKIHPCVKEANSVMFPNVSNKDKVKNKLLQIKMQLKPAVTVLSEQNSFCSSSSSSPQILPTDQTKNSSQSAFDEFELNPIFTGETISQNDIAEIFPPVNSFIDCNDDSMSDADCCSYLPKPIFENEMRARPASSSSTGINSSVTFVKSSPTSSENSPSWKLRLSPGRFVPEPVPSPTIYFRHKMF